MPKSSICNIKGKPQKRMVIDHSDTINRFTELDASPMPNISKMVEDITQYSIFTRGDLKSAYPQIPISDNDRKYTAFEVNDKLYKFTRSPFGASNGVSTSTTSLTKKNCPMLLYLWRTSPYVEKKTRRTRLHTPTILQCS